MWRLNELLKIIVTKSHIQTIQFMYIKKIFTEILLYSYFENYYEEGFENTQRKVLFKPLKIHKKYD